MAKISYSRGGKISTGQWENTDIHFSIEREVQDLIAEEEIKKIMEEIDGLYVQKEQQIKNIEPVEVNAREIAQIVRDIRFYEFREHKFPSVSSVVNYKSKVNEYVNITPLKLAQLASRGSIIHKQIEVYIKTGEWCAPETIPECEQDLLFLEDSNAGLEFDDVDFRAFEKAYPMEYIGTEKVIYNIEHEYAGRLDIICVFDGKKTVADIKTGSMTKERELKTLAQLSAYAHAEKDIEQLMIIPLNHKVKQGYSKAIVTDDIETHFLNFLKKRKQLKKDLGL